MYVCVCVYSVLYVYIICMHAHDRDSCKTVQRQEFCVFGLYVFGLYVYARTHVPISLSVHMKDMYTTILAIERMHACIPERREFRGWPWLSGTARR